MVINSWTVDVEEDEAAAALSLLDDAILSFCLFCSPAGLLNNRSVPLGMLALLLPSLEYYSLSSWHMIIDIEASSVAPAVSRYFSLW